MNLIKSVVAMVIAFGFSCPALGQVTYAEFEQERKVTTKAMYALQLYDTYIRSDIDSIKITGINLLLTDSCLNFDFSKAVVNRLLGSFQIRNGEFNSGGVLLKKAAIYFEKVQDYTHASEVFNDIGHRFFLDGQYDEAIITYQKSLKLGRFTSDVTSSFNGQLGLGKSYIARGDTSIGKMFVLNYRDQAALYEKYEAVADAYGYLGMIAEQEKDLSLAHEYYDSSIVNSMRSKSLIHRSHAMTNQAILFFDNQLIDSAKLYFHKALGLREELKNTRPVIESYYNLGSFYKLIDSNEQSVKYFQYSVDLAYEKGFISEELDASHALLSVGLTESDSLDLVERIAYLENNLKERQGIDQDLIHDFLIGQHSVKENDIKFKESITWLLGGVGFLLIISLYGFFTRKTS